MLKEKNEKRLKILFDMRKDEEKECWQEAENNTFEFKIDK